MAPEGFKKSAHLDLWLKEICASTELRERIQSSEHFSFSENIIHGTDSNAQTMNQINGNGETI